MPQADPIADVLTNAPTTAAVRAAAYDAFTQSATADDFAQKVKGMPLPQHVKAQLWDLKSQQTPETPVSPVEPPRTWGDTARDVAIGVVKEAGETALLPGELVRRVPGVASAVDRLYGVPGITEQAFQQTGEALEARNTPQMVGKGLGVVAEMALPIIKGTKAVKAALPSSARAGAKFQNVMGAAKNVPVDISGPGNVALRIQELAERGGSMPKVVRDFLKRVTDPKKPAPNYEEMRDFASNISRLSADDFNRLTPIMKSKISELRVALNKAIGKAAGTVGKGAEYESAMKEYARAARLQKTTKTAKKAAITTGVTAGLGAGAYKLGQIFGVFD